MAGSFNRITIVGNVGRDPEERMLPSGDQVTDVSVATTERRKDGDVTTWFRVSLFGKAAETAGQYLRKGSYVYVEGMLALRAYIGRDGQQRQSLEVRARDMQMLDKASDRGETSVPAINPTTDVLSNLNDVPTVIQRGISVACTVV